MQLTVLKEALHAAGRDSFAVLTLQLPSELGDHKIGALVYRSMDEVLGSPSELFSLSQLATDTTRLEANDPGDLQDALRLTASSSVGVRPKVIVTLVSDGRVHNAPAAAPSRLQA